MNDPADEVDQSGTGVIWRLRQSEGYGVRAADDPIVFELTDANGATVAAISMRAERIEELLRPRLSIFAELQLDGSIFLDSELFALLPPEGSPDLLDLVRQALAPEMLEDEPNLKEQLQQLRRKLSEALSLVDQTLTDLDKTPD